MPFVETSVVDHAFIFVDGHPLVVCTGTSISLTDAGDLLVLPPKAKVVFENMRRAEPEPGVIRLYRRDGTVPVESASGAEGRA